MSTKGQYPVASGGADLPVLLVSGPVTLDGDTVYVNGMSLAKLLRAFTAPDAGDENHPRYSQLTIKVTDPRA